MAARICPQCRTRVDERRARSSPYCLSCGAALGSPPPTGGFGKVPQKSSALPWILGGVGLLMLLVLGGVIALVVILSAARDAAKEPPLATGGPKLETTTAAPPLGVPPTATVTTGKVAATSTAIRTSTPTAPTRIPTVTAPPTVTPAVPPTLTAGPTIPVPPPTSTAGRLDSGAPAGTGTAGNGALVGPFPRARAQSEIDRVAGTLASCKRAGGPFGSGSVRIDFEPDGRTGALSRPPFAGTSVGSCISSRFLAVRIGKFEGGRQSIEKSFIIQE